MPRPRQAAAAGAAHPRHPRRTAQRQMAAAAARRARPRSALPRRRLSRLLGLALLLLLLFAALADAGSGKKKSKKSKASRSPAPPATFPPLPPHRVSPIASVACRLARRPPSRELFPSVPCFPALTSSFTRAEVQEEEVSQCRPPDHQRRHALREYPRTSGPIPCLSEAPLREQGRAPQLDLKNNGRNSIRTQQS